MIHQGVVAGYVHVAAPTRGAGYVGVRYDVQGGNFSLIGR